MKFVWILFVLCIDLTLGSTIYRGAYWNDPVQLCGSRLGLEMSIICRGIYNDDQGSKPKALPFRRKRNILNECCFTTCTRKYLLDNYCSPESKIIYPSAAELEEMVYVNYRSYYSDLVWTVLRYPQPED